MSRRISLALALLVPMGLCAVLAATGTSVAQPLRPAGAAVASELPWSSLTPAQQQALAPLRPTWETTSTAGRLKWLQVAERFPRMPAEERRRVQERMAAWAAMSPADRARARAQFQEARRIGSDERQARWQAYQALPEDERRRLAVAGKKLPAPQAAPAAQSASSALRPAGPLAPGAARPLRATTPEPLSAKRNLVTTPPSPQPRTVAPTVVQVKPGASTTTIAARAKPPLHHQHGLPKIVATPNFVDPNTLLPKRGPQAAAMRSVSSSDPTQQP